MKVSCLCSSVSLAKLKELNKMGALLLTKFSKVRSNSFEQQPFVAGVDRQQNI